MNKSKAKKRKLRYKIIYSVLTLFVVAVFFLIYIKLTERVVIKNLYPTEYRDYFEVKIHQSKANRSCFRVDVNRIQTNLHNKELIIDSYLEKYCDFEEARLNFLLPQIITYYIDNLDNLTYSENISKRGDPYILVSGKDMVDHENYKIKLTANLNYSFYSELSYIGQGAKLNNIHLRFDNGLFGYLCTENCFYVERGRNNIIEENALRGGNSKHFRIEGDQLTFKFNPQSKKAIFWEKILDSFILGLAVLFFHNLFTKEITLIDNLYDNLEKSYRFILNKQKNLMKKLIKSRNKK